MFADSYSSGDVCGIMAEESPCSICDDYNRDDQIICIVEEPQDIFSFEKVDTYKGPRTAAGLLSFCKKNSN